MIIGHEAVKLFHWPQVYSALPSTTTPTMHMGHVLCEASMLAVPGGVALLWKGKPKGEGEGRAIESQILLCLTRPVDTSCRLRWES